MPNLAELRDRVIRATNHTYTDRFHILTLLNDALNQLTDGAKLEGSQSISVVNGTGNYALPATFKAPITLIEGSISEPTEIYELVAIDENKYGYAIYNGQLYIKPKPTEAKTLTLYFYKYATQLAADADTPEIDSQWHDLLSTYATAMIMLLPDMKQYDKGLADRMLTRWEEGKRSFRESMMRKGKRTSVVQKVVW